MVISCSNCQKEEKECIWVSIPLCLEGTGYLYVSAHICQSTSQFWVKSGFENKSAVRSRRPFPMQPYQKLKSTQSANFLTNYDIFISFEIKNSLNLCNIFFMTGSTIKKYCHRTLQKLYLETNP